MYAELERILSARLQVDTSFSFPTISNEPPPGPDEKSIIERYGNIKPIIRVKQLRRSTNYEWYYTAEKLEDREYMFIELDSADIYDMDSILSDEHGCSDIMKMLTSESIFVSEYCYRFAISIIENHNNPKEIVKTLCRIAIDLLDEDPIEYRVIRNIELGPDLWKNEKVRYNVLKFIFHEDDLSSSTEFAEYIFEICKDHTFCDLWPLCIHDLNTLTITTDPTYLTL